MSDVAVQDLDAEQARDLTSEIQNGMRGLQSKIIHAYQGRVWIPLGYASWDAWCDGELAGARPELPREDRREMVSELRDAGMSTRAIGSAIGADQRTVRRDLESNAADAAADMPVFSSSSDKTDDGDNYWTPTPVTSTDGRLFQPKPAPVEGAVWSAEQTAMKDAVERGETVVASLRGEHKELIAWAEKAERYVRIDRRSVWGNPFELPGDGDRDTVIKNYAAHYLPHKPSLLRRLPELRGKVLGCWCAPEPCHGDVLQQECAE